MQLNKLFHEIVRYATLAPSSHNTQCWKFKVDSNSITVLPDFSRRCPVVDPDDHHLYVSLGCAVENIVIAAKAHGFLPEVDSTLPAKGIHVTLTPCATKEASDLYQAIPKRQCSRTDYDGKALSQEELRQLEQAGTGNEVQVVLLTAPSAMETVKDYVIRGNTAQLQNKVFKEEVKSWVRFNNREAASLGDGLAGQSMGHPNVPRWLGGLIFDYCVTVNAENKKIAKQIQTSAGVAVFVSNKDDPIHWVEVGRCYERFALQATVLGVRNAFLNQPVEEKDIRPLFAEALALQCARPDLVVRFGRGPEMPPSFRRPFQDIVS
jgi:hypothetical protein